MSDAEEATPAPEPSSEPSSGPFSEPSSEPVKPSQMLPREQQAGYILAGVVAAGSVLVAGLGAQNLWAAGAGLAAAVVLFVAVRHGHRVFTALAGFLAGLAFFYFFPLELLCLGFSFYLMMRNSNAQAKARRTQPSLSAAERRAAAAARSAARAKRRSGGGVTEATTAKVPAPNRRYTPPKSKPAGRVPPKK